MDLSQLDELLTMLEDQALDDPALRLEWDEEKRHYETVHGAPLDATEVVGGGGARERFREYFLLERPSQRYGVVPALSAWEKTVERVGPGAAGLDEPLFGSYVGIFEVQLTSASGVAVEDLANGRQLVFSTPSLCEGMQPTDLVVGRVFPVDESEVLVSPGAAILRDAKVASAIRRDVGKMREAGGRLRFSQLEFEALFFKAPRPTGPNAGPGAEVETPAHPPLEHMEARLAAFLEENGPEARSGEAPLTFESVRALAHEAQGLGAFLGPVLDRLAFDTDCDLEVARRLLMEYWGALQSSATASVQTPTPRELTAEERRRAVEEFERGRAAGEDLGKLFKKLQADLGIDDDAEPAALDEPDLDEVSEEEEELVADGLGIAPIIQEYSWDSSRVGRPLQAEQEALLSDMAQRIDHGALRPSSVDTMDADCLREYAYTGLVPWLRRRLGHKKSDRPEDILVTAWDTIQEFARWLEREQGLQIVADVDELRRGLEGHLTRILALPSLAGAAPPAGAAWYRLQALRPEGSQEIVPLFDTTAEPREIVLDPQALELLREGDVLLLPRAMRRAAESRLQPLETLPAGAAEHLMQLRDRLST